MKSIPFIFLVLIVNCALFAQQIPDTSYNPIILKPEYDSAKGPEVFIDEGHQNFHTKNGCLMAGVYFYKANLTDSTTFTLREIISVPFTLTILLILLI